MIHEKSVHERSVCDESEDMDVTGMTKKKEFIKKRSIRGTFTWAQTKLANLSEHDPLCLSVLTIIPDCWSIRNIASEFGVSLRMAHISKKLKEEIGVLAIPQSKKGKILPESIIQKVIEFYESDENGRIIPNKKDFVSVKIDGNRERFQKRLLSDIKFLHMQFKEQYSAFSIGLSKFAELRPQWCVLAGGRGTYSVCVCVCH